MRSRSVMKEELICSSNIELRSDMYSTNSMGSDLTFNQVNKVTEAVFLVI